MFQVFHTIDPKGLREAIAFAETKTDAEIVIHIEKRSSSYVAERLLVLVCVLTLGYAFQTIAHQATWVAEGYFLAIDLLWMVAAAVIGTVIAFWGPAWRLILACIGEDSEIGQRPFNQACRVFLAKGVGTTKTRTGILIYVSLLEHRVLILADAGISAQVKPGFWQSCSDKVADHLKREQLQQGLQHALEDLGKRLGEIFPATTKKNELPDEVYDGQD